MQAISLSNILDGSDVKGTIKIAPLSYFKLFTQEERTPFLPDFPVIWDHVVSFLNGADCINLSKTSKALNTFFHKKFDHKEGIRKSLARAHEAVKYLPNIHSKRYQILGTKECTIFESLLPVDENRFMLYKPNTQHTFTLVETELRFDEGRDYNIPDFYAANNVVTTKCYAENNPGEQIKLIQIYEFNKIISIRFDRTKQIIEINHGRTAKTIACSQDSFDIAATYDHLLVISSNGLRVYNLNTLDNYFLASIKGKSIVTLNKGADVAYLNDHGVHGISFKNIKIPRNEGFFEDVRPSKNIRDYPIIDKFLMIVFKIVNVIKDFLLNVLINFLVAAPFILLISATIIMSAIGTPALTLAFVGFTPVILTVLAAPFIIIGAVFNTYKQNI